MEAWIDWIEKELPPIKTFFISGGTELAALLDVSRTLARKAERRAVAGIEAREFKLDPATLAFLNRLSSLLYALARLSNHKSGITEVPPTYS
jgi:cob(I)alamin adenosyltransferase